MRVAQVIFIIACQFIAIPIYLGGKRTGLSGTGLYRINVSFW